MESQKFPTPVDANDPICANEIAEVKAYYLECGEKWSDDYSEGMDKYKNDDGSYSYVTKKIVGGKNYTYVQKTNLCDAPVVESTNLDFLYENEPVVSSWVEEDILCSICVVDEVKYSVFYDASVYVNLSDYQTSCKTRVRCGVDSATVRVGHALNPSGKSIVRYGFASSIPAHHRTAMRNYYGRMIAAKSFKCCLPRFDRAYIELSVPTIVLDDLTATSFVSLASGEAVAVTLEVDNVKKYNFNDIEDKTVPDYVNCENHEYALLCSSDSSKALNNPAHYFMPSSSECSLITIDVDQYKDSIVVYNIDAADVKEHMSGEFLCCSFPALVDKVPFEVDYEELSSYIPNICERLFWCYGVFNHSSFLSDHRMDCVAVHNNVVLAVSSHIHSSYAACAKHLIPNYFIPLPKFEYVFVGFYRKEGCIQRFVECIGRPLSLLTMHPTSFDINYAGVRVKSEDRSVSPTPDYCLRNDEAYMDGNGLYYGCKWNCACELCWDPDGPGDDDGDGDKLRRDDMAARHDRDAADDLLLDGQYTCAGVTAEDVIFGGDDFHFAFKR